MTCQNTRSSLEVILDLIKQRDEQPVDVPPALPIRPVSRARLPSGRRKLPLRLHSGRSIECFKENEVNSKDEYRNDIVTRKNDVSNLKNDSRERPPEKILQIQKIFRGRQVHCYYLQLRKGSIALQSFIRAEKARKNYQLLSRRIEAAKTLQSGIRGWLTRKSISEKKFRVLGIDYKEAIRKPGNVNSGTKVSPPSVAELQKRLLMVETDLGNKEKENDAIKQQLHQFDEKWLHYENEMKAAEKKWRDQLASLRMSLLAAKNSVASKHTRERLGDFIPISTHGDSNSDETTPKQVQRTMNDFLNLRNTNEILPRNNKIDDTSLRIQTSSSTSQDEELRNLKLRFEVWKKEYKVQLQEAKTILQKLGHLETKKISKKCWWR